jgi:hypothetical protein
MLKRLGVFTMQCKRSLNNFSLRFPLGLIFGIGDAVAF